MPEAYQPYYLAYCRAEGRTPEAQLAHDDARFPGGVMTGYILWIAEQWRRFAAATGFEPLRNQDALDALFVGLAAAWDVAA